MYGRAQSVKAWNAKPFTSYYWLFTDDHEITPFAVRTHELDIAITYANTKLMRCKAQYGLPLFTKLNLN